MNFVSALKFYGCLIVTAYSTTTLDDQYIGCYPDSETNGEFGDETINTSMTISTCIEYCKLRHRTYAGAQNGIKCLCGDSYGKNGTSTKCNVVCGGDSTYNCGGMLQNSVYAVCPINLYGPSCDKECHCKNRMPCHIRNGSCLNGCANGWTGKDCNTTTSSAPLSHQGCYRNDITYLPFIWKYVLANNFMTIQWCIDECRAKYPQSAYLYAGVQVSYECTCGYSNYTGAGTSNNCGTGCIFSDCACTGNSRQKRCGGRDANDVYSVCQFGYFGTACSQQCHCANGSSCTMETGNCGSSGCAPGWSGSACNVRKCSDNNGDCRGDHEICSTESLGPGAPHVVTRCRCKKGYSRTMEHENCIDVDECLPWMDNECDNETSVCKNSVGDYSCVCFEGFTNTTGDKICKDKSIATSRNVETIESPSLKGSDGSGLIFGLILGVVFVLLLIVTITLVILCRKRKPRGQGNCDSVPQLPTPAVGRDDNAEMNEHASAYESVNINDVDDTAPIYTQLMKKKLPTSDVERDDDAGMNEHASAYESANINDVNDTPPIYTQLMRTK